MPADLQALFSLVPPGQILFASDAPYGHPRCRRSPSCARAIQVGLSTDQVRGIASEQSLRIAAGEPLTPAGAAVGNTSGAGHCCWTASRNS